MWGSVQRLYLCGGWRDTNHNFNIGKASIIFSIDLKSKFCSWGLTAHMLLQCVQLHEVCHVWSCDIMWHLVKSCDIMWSHVMSCDIFWSHVTSCDMRTGIPPGDLPWHHHGWAVCGDGSVLPGVSANASASPGKVVCVCVCGWMGVSGWVRDVMQQDCWCWGVMTSHPQ